MTRSINANAPGQGGESAKQITQPSHSNLKASEAEDARLSLHAHSGELRVDSRIIANHLGLQHRSIYALLTRYKSDFKELGILRFQIALSNKPGQPERFALLNEDQSYLLLTYSRNTAKVRQLKIRLVKAFREARQEQELHQTEYLPTYHSLHDEIARLAGGSTNQRFIHMNVNKVINKAVGVRPGGRRTLPLPSKSLLVVAQSMAREAIAQANDPKEGYQAAKRALQGLSSALEVSHHA